MAAAELYPPVEVKVWGDDACFTRPEMKVERVSYEVMTPSAARGILEAIFWKPEFRWRVRAIPRAPRGPVLLHPAQRGQCQGVAAQRRRMAGRERRVFRRRGSRPTSYTRPARCGLRHCRGCRSCALASRRSAKYRDQFRRRVMRGQCHSMPYLGCREFTAAFALPDGGEDPIERSVDLGRMLFDLDYADDGSGRGTPRFFEARLERGVVRVPPALYEREV